MRFLLILSLLCSWAWAEQGTDQEAGPGGDGAPHAFAARYRLRRDGLPVGETLVRLELFPDGTYRYSALTRPNAFASLWRDDVIEEVSEGDLVDGRPRPRRYSYRRSGDNPRDLVIRFDWPSGRLRMTGDSGHWTAPLAPGVLDKLVQQWALSLDLARLDPLPRTGPVACYRVADGGRIKTYTYEIEALDGAGLHLRLSKDGKDSNYGLVLAPRKGWLPVWIERRYGGHLWQMELLTDGGD